MPLSPKVGLAVHHPKANKQARLVERKVCFISNAGKWWGANAGNICPKASPSRGNQWGRSLYRWKEGATYRNSTIGSDSQLQTGQGGSVIVVILGHIQKTKIMASGPITSWEIDGETVETVRDFILGGSKITADGDCSHEIKRRFLLGRKVMTNLDSILKSRDIILPTKVRLVKAMVFPVVMYGCESWTIKKAER